MIVKTILSVSGILLILLGCAHNVGSPGSKRPTACGTTLSDEWGSLLRDQPIVRHRHESSVIARAEVTEVDASAATFLLGAREINGMFSLREPSSDVYVHIVILVDGELFGTMNRGITTIPLGVYNQTKKSFEDSFRIVDFRLTFTRMPYRIGSQETPNGDSKTVFVAASFKPEGLPRQTEHFAISCPIPDSDLPLSEEIRSDSEWMNVLDRFSPSTTLKEFKSLNYRLFGPKTEGGDGYDAILYIDLLTEAGVDVGYYFSKAIDESDREARSLLNFLQEVTLGTRMIIFVSPDSGSEFSDDIFKATINNPIVAESMRLAIIERQSQARPVNP